MDKKGGLDNVWITNGHVGLCSYLVQWKRSIGRIQRGKRTKNDKCPSVVWTSLDKEIEVKMQELLSKL